MAARGLNKVFILPFRNTVQLLRLTGKGETSLDR